MEIPELSLLRPVLKEFELGADLVSLLLSVLIHAPSKCGRPSFHLF